MKRILILCIALLISIPECCACTAYSPLIEWNTTIPRKRQGYDIAITPDGGYLVLGHENDEPLLAKLNKTGDIEWIKNIETENKGESFTMAFTPDNGIVYAGIATLADSGINLIKTDMKGEIQWEKPVTGTKFYFPMYLTVDQDGDIIVTGNINKEDNIFLMKASPLGDLLWMKRINGSGDAYSFSVATTNDGYIISGYTDAVNASGMYTAKFSREGVMLWNTTVKRGVVASRVLDTGEGFILSGHTISRRQGNIVLAGLNNEGFVQWVHEYTDRSSVYAYDAVLTDLGVLVCGRNGNDLFLMEATRTGKSIWNTTIIGLGETYGNGLIVFDDGIVIVGSINDVDLLVLKVNKPDIHEPDKEQVDQEPVIDGSDYRAIWIIPPLVLVLLLFLLYDRKSIINR